MVDYNLAGQVVSAEVGRERVRDVVHVRFEVGDSFVRVDQIVERIAVARDLRADCLAFALLGSLDVSLEWQAEEKDQELNDVGRLHLEVWS